MTTKNIFTNAQFVGSFPSCENLPADDGAEIAFCGRSNSGKSSVINALTKNKKLAKTSKTPGRTQAINIFSLKDYETRRLIDLPGYGYAKVSKAMRNEWAATIDEYLNSRTSIRGLIIIMDIRHPFKDSDDLLIDWCETNQIPVLALLNKSDKLSKSKVNQELSKGQKRMKDLSTPNQVIAFSSKDFYGLDNLSELLEELLD
jgi:GTP-binding protein